MTIYGCDISHHQGTDIDFQKMWNSGFRFLYHKVSQGVHFQDDCALANLTAARAVGFKVGPYHFPTLDNALEQYEWFKTCVEGMDFDLPPALDCEKYQDESMMWHIATETIVDVIGMKLTGWMAIRPKLAIYQYPTIYTNENYGNQVFHSPIMSRYLLMVASWGGTKPTIPTIWKNEKPFIWQNEVSTGQPHGLKRGNIDHDVWMDRFPFPDGEPEQTPPIIPPPTVIPPIIPTITAIPEFPVSVRVRITADSLNIRKNPSSDDTVSPRVGKLYKGTILPVINAVAGANNSIWLNIGYFQWCAMRYFGVQYAEWVT
jgi:GH25 family lysozyme M1 (1,4-beta-N-acetylmuramidase)